MMWIFSQEVHPKLQTLPNNLQICYSKNAYFVGEYLMTTKFLVGEVKSELPSTIDINEIKGKLATYLFNLYDENEFGLWIVNGKE